MAAKHPPTSRVPAHEGIRITPLPNPDPHPTPAPSGWTPLPAPPAQITDATRVQLVLRRLICNHTTEDGHDEVYYVFGGVDGTGKQVSHRGPDATQSGDADDQTAWNMNDDRSEPIQSRTLNARLCNEALAPGQRATFGIGFLESDGQDWGATLRTAFDIGSKVASALGGGAGAGIAGQIASWLTTFIPKNQDDALGAFSLEVSNHGGTVVVEDLEASDFTSVKAALDRIRGTFTLHFQHDDGDYYADFQVRGA